MPPRLPQTTMGKTPIGKFPPSFGFSSGPEPPTHRPRWGREGGWSGSSGDGGKCTRRPNTGHRRTLERGRRAPPSAKTPRKAPRTVPALGGPRGASRPCPPFRGPWGARRWLPRGSSRAPARRGPRRRSSPRRPRGRRRARRRPRGHPLPCRRLPRMPSRRGRVISGERVACPESTRYHPALPPDIVGPGARARARRQGHMNNPLPFEPLLILTPTRAGLSPEFQANLAQLPGAIPIFHPGESDISQARQIVATLAEEFLQSANPRAQAVRFVLWLDDDMQALPETVAAHMALLERSGLEAISGRYVQRRAAALAAVLNPDDDGKPVVLEADDGR